MSAPNFYYQDDFEMYVFVPRYDEDYIKEYEEETETEFNCDDQAELDYECEIEAFNELVANIKKNCGKELMFFNLELKDGYYVGLQIMVNEKRSDAYGVTLNPEYFTDSECESWFGMNQEQALKAYVEEINYINNKVLPYISDNSGFEHIRCIGVASNGEGFYKRVA